MGGSFLLLLRLLAIVAGLAALAWQPDAAWVERAYSNGGYPGWEQVAFALTNPMPWSAGDHRRVHRRRRAPSGAS